VASQSLTIPSLFVWIVASAGDDLASGFAQAAELYTDRARRRAELLLNLVLPCALLALGLMIMGQIEPFLTSVFDIFAPIFKAQQVFGGLQ
jgi:type II secretory pathway component PulF